MARSRSHVGPAPSREELREAALRHLSRFAATEAGLVRVLERRIARWARAAEADAEAEARSREAAREVARGLVAAGAIDDAAFAQARARRLVRGGRSRRAVAAHLAAKGVAAEVAAAALPGMEGELLAAIAFAKRRRIGPFGASDFAKGLGMMARAGFGREVAERALRLDLEQAEGLLVAGRQG